MVSERGLQVLHAIVSDYVASNEPVGSKSLAEKYQFGVSSATIRNEMAALEEAELIAAPHTSSGRVPTDKGYRLYVDTLSKLSPITAAQRTAIERFLGESQDLDTVMQRTVRLLARLTNQVAVVQYPVQRQVVVRHIELVPLASNRVLSVLITGRGSVEQQVVVLPAAQVAEAWVSGLRDTIAQATTGRTLGEALTALQKQRERLPQWADEQEQELIHRVFTVVESQLSAGLPERLTVAGTANLSKAEDLEFGHVLETLEEQVTLLRLFGELDDLEIAASIGRENEPYGLTGAALITGVYSEDTARVGVLGPTRMDYAGNIAAVRAVARYLRKLLGSDDPGQTTLDWSQNEW